LRREGEKAHAGRLGVELFDQGACSLALRLDHGVAEVGRLVIRPGVPVHAGTIAVATDPAVAVEIRAAREKRRARLVEQNQHVVTEELAQTGVALQRRQPNDGDDLPIRHGCVQVEVRRKVAARIAVHAIESGGGQQLVEKRLLRLGKLCPVQLPERLAHERAGALDLPIAHVESGQRDVERGVPGQARAGDLQGRDARRQVPGIDPWPGRGAGGRTRVQDGGSARAPTTGRRRRRASGVTSAACPSPS